MARPSMNPMLPAPATTERRARPTGGERARVLVLGVNLWLVMAALPAMIGQHTPALGASLAVLLPLAGGTLLLGNTSFEGKTRLLAVVALLGVVPASTLGVVLFLERSLPNGSHPPLALALGSASLLAYLAGTAGVLARPAERPDVRHRDMTTLGEDPDGFGRRWRRRLVLTVAGFGALALALVAPFAGGEAALFRAWGDTADAAGTLAAAVGGALGVLVLAAFIGPGLRRQRPPPIGRQRWRVAMFTLVAVSGAVVHTLLQRG